MVAVEPLGELDTGQCIQALNVCLQSRVQQGANADPVGDLNRQAGTGIGSLAQAWPRQTGRGQAMPCHIYQARCGQPRPGHARPCQARPVKAALTTVVVYTELPYSCP